MGSSIPAARANLYAMLAAAPALAEPVQVGFGLPGIYQALQVVGIRGIGNVATDDEVLATGGPVQEERYAILLRLQVVDLGAGEDDLPALDARLWELYDAVRDVVMGDRTLDGALFNGWANVATADPEDSPAPAIGEDGRQAGYMAWTDLKILCRSRIT